MQKTSVSMCGTTLAAFALALPGCGWFGSGDGGSNSSGPHTVCVGYYCGDFESYQHCYSGDAGGDQTESYNFGPSSCTCSGTDETCLTQCTEEIAAYCGIATMPQPDQSVVADAGTNDDGGSSDGGSSVTCTATFSGAVVGTASCSVMLGYSLALDFWDFNVAGTFSNAAYQWSGLEFSRQDNLTTGTFNQSGAFDASSSLGSPNVTSPLSLWTASGEGGTTVGAATLTFTSIGDGVAQPDQLLYPDVHGSWTGTLANETGGEAPVQLTVTF